jgi:hypothetical protein
MTEDAIKVFENVFTQDDFNSVYLYSQTISSWNTQASSGSSLTEFLYHEVTDIPFFNSYLFGKIGTYLDEDYSIQRIYFNGQWSGRNGDFHVDRTSITVLIYVSKYQFGWGGFTEFLLPDNKQVIVSPIQNRMIYFPGNIKHKAYSFSYQDCPMRISLAYKLQYNKTMDENK